MQVQLDGLRTRYGDAYPDVKRLRKDIEWVQRMEAEQETKNKAAGAPADAKTPDGDKLPAAQDNAEAPKPPEAQKPAPPAAPLSPELTRARQQITMIQTQLGFTNKEIETRTAERQRILRDIASNESRINRLPVREQEMAKILRDYEISKENYKSLLQKSNAAEMATDMERREKAERFTMLDPARVPEKPFSPNRPLLSGIGCVFSLALGLALGFGKEFKKNVLLGEWELSGTYVVLSRVPRIDMFKNEEEPGPDPDRPSASRSRGQKWRAALLSSAVFSLLAIVAAGVYFAINRL
jgi:uncharacterized protein involved in exopolysaccharide biosynthesis